MSAIAALSWIEPNVRGSIAEVSDERSLMGGSRQSTALACGAMFRPITRALACAVVLTASVPAASEQPADEVIIVRLRHPYAICAGFCPHFEITVSSTGSVISQAPEGTLVQHIYRYQVSRRQVAAFRRILSTVRPRGVRQLDKTCTQATKPDGSADTLDDPRPDDVMVRWIGRRSEARLTSCSYTHPRTRRVVERAVRALGAELSQGNRQGSDD